MAMRFSSTGVSVGVAGVTFTHGITKGGVSTAPDNWHFNYATSAGVPAGPTAMYRVSAATSTTIQIASTSGTAIVDFSCWKHHSVTGNQTGP